MRELEPKTKTLLAQARAAEARLPSHREAAYAALSERLATPPTPPTQVPGGAGAVGKLIAGAGAVIVMTGAGAVGLWRIHARHRGPAHETPSASAKVVPAPVPAAATTEPKRTRPEHSTAPSLQAPSRRRPPRPSRPTVPERKIEVPAALEPERSSGIGGAEQEPAPAATASSLSAEIELLREAQLKVQAGDGRAALALLDRHRALYATGVLSQEREAARILALCLLGRAREAQREADAFAQAWPRSPQLGHIRASCAGSGAPGESKNR